jgi:D-3-phosphoglycerate dehydrogenase
MTLKCQIALATDKPFSEEAVSSMEKVIMENSMYEFTRIERYGTQEELIRRLKDISCQGLIVRSDQVDSKVLSALSESLKIVVRAGAGYDNINLPKCSELGIIAENTPGQNANAVAELVIGLMIKTARNHYDGTTGLELHGRKIGLNGCGAVSRALIKLVKAFEMEVMAFDPFLSKDQILEAGATPVDSVAALFDQCHYVSLHVPATSETRGSIGYDYMMALPPKGCLINTARSEVIDEEGLLKALRERPDLSYIADVQSTRLKEAQPEFPKQILMTPVKLGAQTENANYNSGMAAVRQIRDYFENGVTKFQVNKV